MLTVGWQEAHRLGKNGILVCWLW